MNKCRGNTSGIPWISREFLSGNWQYWHNIYALPGASLFCFRFHRQGFLGKWKIIVGVSAWKLGLETLIERKDFRSERFWCGLEPWVWTRLWIRMFTARSFFQRFHESRRASHSKGKHGCFRNEDASSVRKDLCRLSKGTVRCLC